MMGTATNAHVAVVRKSPCARRGCCTAERTAALVPLIPPLSIFHEQQNGHNGGTQGWDFKGWFGYTDYPHSNVGQTQFAQAVDDSCPG